MLHAPTADAQADAAHRTPEASRAPERERAHEQHPVASVWAGGALLSARSPARGSRQALAGMRQTHGNHTLLRMLDIRHVAHPAPQTTAPAPASARPLPLQAKLTVNQPGDAYEQEADRVAEQVMRMPAPLPAVGPTGGSGLWLARDLAQPHVQRCGATPCTCTAEERALHAGAEGELHRAASAVGAAAGTASDAAGQVAPPSVHWVLGSPGRPLDPAARAFLEPRFGRDFGAVRVHDDAQAAASARAVRALAYTVGQDVVFGAGRYAPESSAGQRLLAHELAHVVQQDGGVAHLSGPHASSQTGDAIEREADAAGQSITAERQTPVAHRGLPAQIQRLIQPPTIPVNLCPTSVGVGALAQFNHSNLPADQKDQWGTYLGVVSRMEVGPGPDHSGHCMQEHLRLVSSTCPAAVSRDTQPCSKHDCLYINSIGIGGDKRTRTYLTDGPTAFLDLHRSPYARSLLEGTGVNACQEVCEQQYTCDTDFGTLASGTFRIIRDLQASSHTRADGTTMHITTGTVTKAAVPQTPAAPSPPYQDAPLNILPEGTAYT